jgi:hypothetical protein
MRKRQPNAAGFGLVLTGMDKRRLSVPRPIVTAC